MYTYRYEYDIGYSDYLCLANACLGGINTLICGYESIYVDILMSRFNFTHSILYAFMYMYIYEYNIGYSDYLCLADACLGGINTLICGYESIYVDILMSRFNFTHSILYAFMYMYIYEYNIGYSDYLCLADACLGGKDTFMYIYACEYLFYSSR
jgi:hypothetical protein